MTGGTPLLSVRRLEGVPELRIFPFARFFDFKRAIGSTEVHTSWFFIALSFHIPKTAVEAAAGGVHNVDLTAVIHEFAFVVDQWEHRHGGMDLQVDHLRRRDVPAWVVESTDGCSVENQQQLKKRSGGVEDPKCFSDDETPHTQKKPKSDAAAANGKRIANAAS